MSLLQSRELENHGLTPIIRYDIIEYDIFKLIVDIFKAHYRATLGMNHIDPCCETLGTFFTSVEKNNIVDDELN